MFDYLMCVAADKTEQYDEWCEDWKVWHSLTNRCQRTLPIRPLERFILPTICRSHISAGSAVWLGARDEKKAIFLAIFVNSHGVSTFSHPSVLNTPVSCPRLLVIAIEIYLGMQVSWSGLVKKRGNSVIMVVGKSTIRSRPARRLSFRWYGVISRNL